MSPPILASDYPGASTTLPNGRTPPTNLSGSLSKPLSQYTAAEFDALVSGTALGGGHTRARNCKHFLSCILDGGKTDVTITATSDAMWLSGTNAGANGTIAAIVNGIHHDTDSYPFVKNDTYAFIVYAAVAPNSATWTLERMYKVNGVDSIASVASGNFHECTSGRALSWDSSSADFRECGQVPHPNPGPVSSTQMDMIGFSAMKRIFASLATLYEGDNTSWITCETGCCTMEAS